VDYLCGFLQPSCCVLLTVGCRQFLGIVEAGTWFLYLKKASTPPFINLIFFSSLYSGSKLRRKYWN
jgi:hypothetical protein